MAAEIAKPAEPHARERLMKAAPLRESQVVIGERSPRIVARLHRQQHGDVVDRAAHWALDHHLRVEGIGRFGRDQALRGAEAEHVVERRRIAEGTAHVAAIGDWQHPQGQRHARAAARPAAHLEGS